MPFGATSGINEQVAAGLPNIVGKCGSAAVGFNTGLASNSFANSCTGAFSGKTSANTGGHNEGKNNGWSFFSFDASLSNAIYGASATVTPPSVKTAFLIKHD